MARKCKKEQVKRQRMLIDRYKERRAKLVAIINDPEMTLEDRLEAYQKLARIPRDTAETRYRNRCQVTGRPRGYMRKFRMSRNMFRLLAHEGKLPGVTKSSW